MAARYRNIRMSARRLERLGLRAVGALERYPGKHPGIEAFRSLPSLRARHAASHARVRALEIEQRRRHRSSRQALARLSSGMRVWLGALCRHLPDLDRGAYPWTDVADDLIAQNRRLVELARAQPRRGPSALAYRAVLVREQTALGERAEALHRRARQATEELYAARRELQAAAVALHTEVVALRHFLRVTLGRHHPDFRSLRTPRRRSGPATTRS